MPSPFTITAPASTVPLRTSRLGESTRLGQVTFTVSNASGLPLRGRAMLVPENPSCAPWLRVEGEAERDFAVGDTEQYLVQVRLPAGAAAGDYVFRLDMVGVENPDELYTRGPSVTFQAPPTLPVPASKPFPWWIAAVAGAVVVLGALAIALWPRHATVPPVRGLPAAQAIARLTSARLQIAGSEPVADGVVPAGQAVRCDPPEGASVKRGAKVALFVSTGPDLVEVPSLLQAMIADAKLTLEKAGLVAGAIAEEASPFDPGQVLRSDPIEGKRLPRGSAVDLVVSKGLEMIEVPPVAGLPAEEAERKVWAAGFQVRRIVEEFNALERGRAIRTDPPAGERAPQGLAVDLYVSRGPVPTPVPLPTATPAPVYSLFDHAAEAVWTSNDPSRPVVPWLTETRYQMLGAGADNCTGRVLEDGRPCARAIYSHPALKNDGWVQGEFSVPIIYENQHFMARIGFHRDVQNRTNGVDVWVSFNGQVIYHKAKTYGGWLEPIDIPLGAYAGQGGKLVIRVDASGNANYDWFCWVDPRIAAP